MHRATLEDLRLERYRRERTRRRQARAAKLAKPATESLATFVLEAWPIAEPGARLVWNWHLDAICEHLQAVTEGHLRRLIVNVPPRMTKSMLTCVLWPAWEWARDPTVKWLFASHEQALATRDSVKMRRLLESTWYRDRWPHVRLTPDQNQKTRYDTSAGGYRLAKSFGGSATGEGGNRRVVDDPHAADDVHSPTRLQAQLDWWRYTWSTREVDPTSDTEVVIMQRLHERDLTGYLLEEVGGYEHLMLPMRYEPERSSVTSLGWEDPRTTPGELLNPQRFDLERVDRLEMELGEYGTAGQLQQDPKPAGGGILKEAWWRYWIPAGTARRYGPVRVRDEHGDRIEVQPTEIPDFTPDHVIQSWDLAFKATDGASRVAGGVYRQWGADVFLIDLVEQRMTFTETLTAMRDMAKRYPDAFEKVVEDKANGPAVMDTLRRELGGFIPGEPHGSKEARTHAVSPRIQAGNVYLPHPKVAPWVESARGALSTFPATTRTDVVDQLTQALAHLPMNAVAYSDARTLVHSRRSSLVGGRR